VTEIAALIRELGVPTAGFVVLGVVLYKIGTICGKLLIDAWAAKDTKLVELEKRIEQVQNGQRAALEQRLDASIEQARLSGEQQEKTNDCLYKLGLAFHHFAENRPCLHDSDLVIVNDATPSPDDKTLRVIARKKVRDAKRTETAEG